MEKIYEKMVEQYTQMNDTLKDAICDRMKVLGEISFNTERTFPFQNCEGEFIQVRVMGLRYDHEFQDVTAISETGSEWYLQEEGTVDGCLELLYYVEKEAYKVTK